MKLNFEILEFVCVRDYLIDFVLPFVNEKFSHLSVPERYKLKTEKDHLTKVTVYLIHSSPEAIRNAVTSDLLVNW